MCIYWLPTWAKGYKVYDIKSKRIYTSRDVKFFENIFPYASRVDEIREKRNTEWNTLIDSDELLNEVHHREDTCEEASGVDQSDSTHVDQSDSNEGNGQEEIVNTRPSGRVRWQPSHLRDYEVDLPRSIDHTQPTSNSESSTVHPLANYVSYNKFSHAHKCFLVAINKHDEPKFFSQAVKVPHWQEAMAKEIAALEANGTWDLEHLPPGKRAIDSKWVYKVKYKPTGEVERYKARLVAKGFTQIEGIDFHETFAPVAKLVTVRSLLAVAVKRNWILHQLDVNNAFLHGDLIEDVYMKIPQGFAKSGDTRVCKLRKSLYGLRQASRNWYHKFTQAILDAGFRQSRADHSLFIFKQGHVYVAVLIYVDDVILAGNNEVKIQELKIYLDRKFSIKDLGPLKYFLGIEVARSADGIVLSQRKYTLDILKDCGMEGCRTSLFPMEQNARYDLDENSPVVDAMQYRRLIGKLLYLTVTRPDIQYAVNVLSQFISSPRESHMNVVLRVLRYLKGAPGQGLFLPAAGDLSIEAYCDSDWGGCPMTRRSRTGYFISLGGAPISWRTKKQTVVSRSSAEAEYRAMAATVSEVVWLRWLLTDLEARQMQSTPLHCDNQAARHIANNPVFHERTKHVEMDCYFVRERIESKDVETRKIATSEQLADVFTKALGADQFLRLIGKLGIRDLHLPT